MKAIIPTTIIVSIVLLFCLKINSQELIQDGGFEEITFDKKDTSWYYNNWKSLLYHKKFKSNSGPKFSLYKKELLSQDTNKLLKDVFIDLKTGDTIEYTLNKAYNLLDLHKPYEGDSYLITPNISIRNLSQGKLLHPILKDSFYRLTFAYKIICKNIPAKKVEYIVANNIGLFFSEIDLSTPKTIKNLKKLNIFLPFHFYINNFNFENRNCWVPIVIDFKAEKDYNYIIIGNNDILTDASEVRPWKFMTYIFDNFSLKRISQSQAKYNYKPGENIEFSDTDNSEKIRSLVKIPVVQNLKLKCYYQHIGKAENLIIDKKYKEALTEYCNAFDCKVPFFRDFINTTKLITKFKINDSLLLRKFFIASQKYAPYKNAVKDRVEYLQKIDTIYKTSYLDFFKVDPSLENISFAGKMDSALIRKIFSMSDSDQGSRINKSGIKNADESNYDSILKLYKEYKEISELTIGQWPMENLKIMFLHFCRYENKEWIDLLQTEVMKGNFDNRTFAWLVDSYIENNMEPDVTKSYYLSYIGYAHHTKYCIPSIEKKLIDEVNKRRAEIYLDPVESQQRKQLYNFRNGYEDFMFYSFFSYDPMHPDSTISEVEAVEQEKEFIENLKMKYPVLKTFEKSKINYDIDFK
jgi:hypothetical protein